MKINEQSRRHSVIETGLNVGSGFLLSWLMWVWLVGPLWGIPFDIGDSLEITALFTITSVARSYLWRRVANWKAKCDVRNS